MPMHSLVKINTTINKDNVKECYRVSLATEDDRCLYGFISIMANKLDGKLQFSKVKEIYDVQPDTSDLYSFCQTNEYDVTLKSYINEKSIYMTVLCSNPLNLYIKTEFMDVEALDSFIADEMLRYFLHLGYSCYANKIQEIENGTKINDSLGSFYAERFIFSLITASDKEEVLKLIGVEDEKLMDDEYLVLVHNLFKFD